MNDDYEYQLLICDDEFYSGFLVSGHRKIIVSEPGCYKRCGHWCGDFTSPYFRTAGIHSMKMEIYAKLKFA